MQFSKFFVASFAAFAVASPVAPVEKRSVAQLVGDVKTLVNGLLTDADTVLADLGVNLTDVLGGSVTLKKREGVSIENALAEAEKRDDLVERGNLVGDVEKLVSDLLKNVIGLAGDAGVDLSGLLSGLGL